MGADSSAENTPNAQKFICPISLPQPKSFGFQWKTASLGIRSLCLKAKQTLPIIEIWKENDYCALLVFPQEFLLDYIQIHMIYV